MGDVRYSAVVGIAASWITTPPLTWYLGDYLGLGAVGGWLALTAEITVATVVLWHRLIRGGWRDAADRTRAEMERASRASLVPEAAQ